MTDPRPYDPTTPVTYDELIRLFSLTESPVPWAYDVWDPLVRDLTHPDPHKRAFAAQLLARLAIGDPERRILRDFSAIAAVMRDPKFVTARHTLQSLWRIGLAGADALPLVLDAYEQRFRASAAEKNVTLIRTDVIVGLARLHLALSNPTIAARAEALIAAEPNDAARKKQAAIWRKTLRG